MANTVLPPEKRSNLGILEANYTRIMAWWLDGVTTAQIAERIADQCDLKKAPCRQAVQSFKRRHRDHFNELAAQRDARNLERGLGVLEERTKRYAEMFADLDYIQSLVVNGVPNSAGELIRLDPEIARAAAILINGKGRILRAVEESLGQLPRRPDLRPVGAGTEDGAVRESTTVREIVHVREYRNYDPADIG